MAFNPAVRASVATANEDRRWIKTLMGYDQCRSVTLDSSAFVADHLAKKGAIPSGIVLAKITATGLYGPYNNAGAGGLEVAAGFLFNSVWFDNLDGVALNLATAPDVAATLYWGPGIVDQDFLPTFASATTGLLNAAGRTDLAAHIRFEGTDL